MKKNVHDILDQHLSFIEGMQEVKPDPFFYTRLKARMEKENTIGSWEFPFKPAWVIGILVALLALNGLLIVQESKSTKGSSENGIQALAASYDQVVSD